MQSDVIFCNFGNLFECLVCIANTSYTFMYLTVEIVVYQKWEAGCGVGGGWGGGGCIGGGGVLVGESR